ncbi:MAG: hypothetical protein DDT34_02470 [Firmicutes bacterium]|nr:hypothetical protein [Bacillota bacterium]
MLGVGQRKTMKDKCCELAGNIPLLALPLTIVRGRVRGSFLSKEIFRFKIEPLLGVLGVLGVHIRTQEFGKFGYKRGCIKKWGGRIGNQP